MEMKKIAVILSGCGVFDGSEIHEVVLSLLAIEHNGAEWVCFAPNIYQHHALEHSTGTEHIDSRHVMEESSRLSRGEISDVATLDANDFDALIVPGGFGAAKNLSNFALDSAMFEINPHVLKACKSFKKATKPTGFMCISPVMLPAIYGKGVKCTIGNDTKVADFIESQGGKHVNCMAQDIIWDDINKVGTTPAYMTAKNMLEVQKGISKLIEKVISES